MRAPVLAAVALVSACTARAPDSANDVATLSRLLSSAHERGIQNSVQAQLKYNRPVDKLPSVSLEAVREDSAFAQALLDTLGSLNRAGLPEQEQVSADALQWMLEGELAGPRFYSLMLSTLTPYQSPLTSYLLLLGRDMPLGTAEERTRYLARLSDIGPLVDTIRATTAARSERGVFMPKPEIKQVDGALGSLTVAGLKSPYAPPSARIAAIPDSARRTFSAAVVRAIDSVVNPALGRLRASLGGGYLGAAPEGIGLKQYAGGEEFYRYLVERNTTLKITPEDVHRRGLAYMDTLERAMDSLQRVIGFAGTRKQFQTAALNDPRFKAKTPEAVGAFYQRYYDAIKPVVGEMFSRQPKAPAEYRRLNPALEASQTYGFYQPPSPASPVGVYFYNASNLSTRSLFSVPSIAYHELVPGHHFQIALANENTALPPLRRDFATTAYQEGWAEYASAVAGELGMYKDPYDAYGRLLAEAFLTMRLVVDPGMNLFGWSRDSAMSYMRAHTVMAESEIASETLRYSVDMPGQALGYKIGAFEFWRLRRKAEQMLGPRFDVREFHATILDAGALPMEVVGKMIDRWIDRRLATR